MGKTGFIFRSTCSDTSYVVSLCPDLIVFGLKAFDPRGWDRIGRIELSSDALQHYFARPDVALEALGERDWYRTSLEDEQLNYLR
jgi:hypothetical protein